jgi:diguanylate cyclase (GGDEF)-like protein/PAS domain S-box-containing protein
VSYTVIVITFVLARVHGWTDVAIAVLFAALAGGWIAQYLGWRTLLAWDLVEGAVILAAGVVVPPIDILLLVYIRLCVRALEAEGGRLLGVLAVYVLAFAGSVAVRSWLSQVGTPLEQLAFLASGFPIAAVVMRNLGASLWKEKALTGALTEQREADQALRNSEANFRILFTANPQPMWVFDRADLQFLEVNTAAVNHYGYTRDEFLGMRITDIRPPEDVELLARELDARGAGLGSSRQWRHVTKDGRTITVDIATHNIEFGGRDAVLVLAQDVTERLELDERLRHQAFHDTLTGLANRALFYDRVEHAVARGQRSEEAFAVLFIDLDNFKAINDTVGHGAGDAVLLEVASRLRHAIRPSDTAARLGGDEFAVLLEPVAGGAIAIAVAERIAAGLNRPVEVEGDVWFVSGSVGIAFSEHSGNSVDTILRNADVAMYNAKKRGRAQFSVFEPEMHESVVARSMLEGELRQAIARDQLTLHYQPQFDLKRLRVTGVEALVRWNHPRRGLLAPGEFIALAEETGLVEELDTWVLENAARQMLEWTEAGLDQLTLGVNVSGREMASKGLSQRIAQTLAGVGLPPSRVELEVTESVAFEAENARATLVRLREAGFRVAIDDFGVGFSMLGRLQDLPVDRLKIDRSFVEKITFGEDEAPIVSGIIAMAHSLRLKVVAEGIETSEQLAFLKRAGCDEGQGYRLGRPMPAAEIEPLLRRAGQLENVGGRVAL